ncbi:unnamed protein product [Ceutorhynchus assimilis]|uniref:SAM domain-containing protein n=1 Tax=Ceutorhynchus assimilis TaxID=467358 RepID=A0A9P0GPW9_9CUCU|nr:unnamed protein product [Ceutorhynchus assimilis]
MAECLPFIRSPEMTRNSDTMSEISDSGTITTSKWGSREEVRDLVTKLGLNDPSELHRERFRIDRCKLEKMLSGVNEAIFPADVFFAKLMDETDTIITWPNRLRVGGKSRRDPHVGIAGMPEDVQRARERILGVLNSTSHRITMKMDVSYTDHSHIIGKGGLSIKRVMDETKCHVHFPDSNRSNPNEKSNQVSISGDIEGVELARSRVRELVPLIFGFELPIKSQTVDLNSPYMVKVREQYKVQVMFKTRNGKLHSTLVLVKGQDWDVRQVKQATLILRQYLCEDLAEQTPFQMSMEISAHHHQFVLGKNHSYLKEIIMYTGCQIMFPDAQDPNIPSLKKSNVTITGDIHNVYKARQLLMGSLPLMVVFDLPEETSGLKVRPEEIAEIQTSCDVNINFRQRANKPTKACVIKGVEKCTSDIYKARNLILGLDEPPIYADIPSSYYIPAPSSPAKDVPTTIPNMGFPVSPLLLSSNYLSPFIFSTPPSPQQHSTECHTNNNNNSWTSLVNQQQQQFFPPDMNVNQLHQFSTNSSGYHSIDPTKLDKTFTADFLNVSGNSGHSSSFSTILSTSTSPRDLSPSGHGSYSDNYGQNQQSREFSAVLKEMNNPGEFHGPTLYRPMPESSPYDYENKRLSAMRAMRAKPNPDNIRVPHNSWSGYGMSHTSPGGFLTDKFKNDNQIGKWTYQSPRPNMQTEVKQSCTPTMMNTSNLLDHTPSQIWNRIKNTSNWCEDLPTLLTTMNLEHYMALFESHEIDMAVFSTLGEQDLINLGINAFGARRKMLLAISAFNKKNTPFSAAPGAERRNSPLNDE